MNSNLRFVSLRLLVPYVACLAVTLVLATPFLPTQKPHHVTRTSVHAPVSAERMSGSRIAHSRLPSVVEQLDQIQDNYAGDVQDQETERRMSAGVGDAAPVVPVDSALPVYPPLKPAGYRTPEMDAQHAANDDTDDPWASRY